MAFGCEPDESLDEMMGGGGRSDANAAVNAGDAAGGAMGNDAGVASPGNASGGNASGGNAGGGNAGGGDAGGGSTGRADASAHNLDAGSTSDHDAGSTGVIIGQSMRRDGGPPRWDPDAAGPILNAEKHAACMMLVQNLCTRVIDCQTELAGLPAARRDQAFESCRSTFLASHNCNRATATASGFAACSEGTKTADCNDVFGTDFGSSCSEQITFQR